MANQTEGISETMDWVGQTVRNFSDSLNGLIDEFENVFDSITRFFNFFSSGDTSPEPNGYVNGQTQPKGNSGAFIMGSLLLIGGIFILVRSSARSNRQATKQIH